MSDQTDREVSVAFAEGVLEDIASLTAASDDDTPGQAAELEALKRRIATLLLECKANTYTGELMGEGRHVELANCRRVRFDIPTHKGKPRFRLIYRNEPTDGAPAECRWLAVAPRAGLHAHRRAQQRLRPHSRP
jgi:hypothetical protein